MWFEEEVRGLVEGDSNPGKPLGFNPLPVLLYV